MILRRLIQHLNQQNWFAVWLDLIVVVVGIFLGMQVSNWNDDRIQRKVLNEYMQSLANEVSNSFDMLNNHIRWQQLILDGLDLSLAALDGKKLTPEETKKAYTSLVMVASPPPYPGKIEVLKEMQSNGYLQLLPKGDLKNALLEILSQSRVDQAFYEREIERITAPDFSPELVSYQLDNDEDSWPKGTLKVSHVDFDEARKDPDFRLRILQGYAAFVTLKTSKEASMQMHKMVLGMLRKAGFIPEENWLVKNLDKITSIAQPKID